MHKPFTVIGLGEVLWDIFPDGPRFGGAPANFACHFAALNGNVHMVSQVGTDELGRRAIEELRRRDVTTEFVAQTAEFLTGTVTVEVDRQGHATYTFGQDRAWDHLQYTENLATLAASADAVCFGTLAQRSAESRETIRRFVRSTAANCLRVLDLNLRPPFFDEEIILTSLEMANTLKLNEDELAHIAGFLGVSGSVVMQMCALARQFSLQQIVVTRGANGAIHYQEGTITECDAVPCDVVDTVGAGDAFTAALVFGLLRHESSQRILQRAGELAAFVCTQPGGTPPLPEELQRRCRQ